MDGTDPRWAWWTEAMETIADRLDRLKTRKRSDTAETVDRRIAKWLGRLHDAGLALDLSHLKNGLTTATIRTMLGKDRSHEAISVSAKPDLKTERCTWFVDLRSDEPGPADKAPDGPGRTRATAASRRIAAAAMKAAHDKDAIAAWRTYARYFRNPAETHDCKRRLLETVKTMERWNATLDPVGVLRAQFAATHAALRVEHDHDGKVGRLSAGVPVIACRTPERGDAERGWAELTVSRTLDDHWRLDSRGAGRLIEAAIHADRNTTMPLSRITGILKRVATRVEMQKQPERAAELPVRETRPSTATRWLRGRGPMTERECGRQRSSSYR